MHFELEEKDVERIAQKVLQCLTPMLRAQRSDDEEIFDVEALASYLKVSPKWIYEKTSRNEIPHVKPTGKLLFRKRDINKWLESSKVPVKARA